MFRLLRFTPILRQLRVQSSTISAMSFAITSSEIIRIIDGQGNIYTAEVLNTDTNRPSSEARILTHEFRAQVATFTDPIPRAAEKLIRWH